jgi:hypothetical protein
MASRIQAIYKYSPHLKQARRVATQDLVDLIVQRTDASESAVCRVLLDLRDALVYFMRQGHSVTIEGLGTYTPTIGLNGRIHIGHRADRTLKRQVRPLENFLGEIIHRENIGRSGDELVALWNAEHPEDPVV